jgi:hypothetical protein
MSTVPPETPLSHAERARQVLDHIRSIKELIGGFTFKGTPDPRTLNYAKSVRDEFFENTAVALEASPDLARMSLITPEEIRDVIAYSTAFTPVAEEFGIMQQSTLHTIALRRASAGDRTLQVYSFGKRLTRKTAAGHQVLIPYLDAMKRTVIKRRRTSPLPEPSPAEPPKKGGTNA